MERVIAYVDGYNLYYGLREMGWRHLYWLNIQVMVKQLLRPNQELAATKYFTTIVKRPIEKNKRQMVFLEALQTLRDFQIFYGHFLSDTVTCNNCGHTYETHHEKMTDVNIAVELMSDAYQDRFDVALLVTADSDLIAPVRTVHRLFNEKKVVIAFPPSRSSAALKSTANRIIHIDRNTLAKSIFPDRVVKPNGYVLQRPATWR